MGKFADGVLKFFAVTTIFTGGGAVLLRRDGYGCGAWQLEWK